MDNSNQIDKYKEAFNKILDSVASIDRKSGLIFSAISFIFAAVSFTRESINKWALITCIFFLTLSVLTILLAVFPIFWNRKEDDNNPLYVPNMWSKKNRDKFNKDIDLAYLAGDINIDHYKSQIRRVTSIYRFKLGCQITSIISVAIALIVFLVDIMIVY